MRPTFEVRVGYSVEEAVGRLRDILGRAASAQGGAMVVGQAAGQHLTLTVQESARHFWSPWLHVHVHLDELDDSSVIVWGRFSPHPKVWSAYLLGYVGLAAIAMIALGWGLSQMSLEQTPWMLIGTALAFAAAGVMLWSSRVGQRLAREQMRLIYREVCAALETEPVLIRGP